MKTVHQDKLPYKEGYWAILFKKPTGSNFYSHWSGEGRTRGLSGEEENIVE